MRKIKLYVMLAAFAGLLTLNAGGEDKLKTAANTLVGEHPFGVQFIWDGYGTCTIKKEKNAITIEGSQLSQDKEDYLFIKGTVKIIGERVFTVTGSLKMNIKDCCGKVEKEGTFTFKRWGNREFWRLQNPERESLCDMYVCHYYIDVFMKERASKQ